MSHYVYILTNHTRMFYVGMTDAIRRRTFEHKTGFYPGSFADKYQVTQLVYYEQARDFIAALREKQLKSWTRAKKIVLVERANAQWVDLADRWFATHEIESGIMRFSALPPKERAKKSPTSS